MKTRETRPFTPYIPRGTAPDDNSRTELPMGYGETRIVVQVRDPYWAHTYWEINQSTRDNLRRELTAEVFSSSIFILRVYDVTGVVFDGMNAHGFNDVHVFEGANTWYLHLGQPNRAFVVDLGLITPTGDFVLIARSNQVNTPRDTFSEVVDDQWMVVEERFHELYRLSGGYRIGASSGELMGREKVANVLALDISSGGVSSLASGGARPVSREREKDFWLVVSTELVVYGATEPDATVTIQGQQVKLRPDGSFAVRFALPDGEQVIPVRAVNNDGDMTRTITPRVDKQTR
jgi:uncharacterized protein